VKDPLVVMGETGEALVRPKRGVCPTWVMAT
jgi:hypothetical protein